MRLYSLHVCSDCRDKLEDEAEFVVVGDISELQAQAAPAEGASNGSEEANTSQEGECSMMLL